MSELKPTGAEYLRKILLSPVYDVAVVTPLQKLEKLSERFDNTILLKREDLQPVHSFKLRGAYNKIAQLPKEAQQKGSASAATPCSSAAASTRPMPRQSASRRRRASPSSLPMMIRMSSPDREQFPASSSTRTPGSPTCSYRSAAAGLRPALRSTSSRFSRASRSSASRLRDPPASRRPGRPEAPSPLTASRSLRTASR